MPGRTDLHFRVLGPFDVRAAEREIQVGGPKQQAVLVILLLNRGTFVGSERLIDELWGEQPPGSAAKSIQVYVSHLRKALGESVIVTRGSSYELAVEPEAVDAHRFERLVAEGRDLLAAGDAREAAGRLGAARSLWRGPALADFAYEPFAQVEIARLEELRLAALEDRIEADLRLGRHRTLVGELDALVALHPLRERLCGQLMLALYRSGRQVEALAAYQHARRRLVDELGIEPTPALQQLEKRILRQDPELELAETADSRRSGLPAPVASGASDVALLAPATERPAALGPQPRPAEDELRPVTVLFADVVGSTALGERLAPDEVNALLGECVTMMSRAVEEYGGTLQAYQREGICAYFGAPLAPADDLERAARAGLRILEVVNEHARDIEAAWGLRDFAVRVGINSGQAAVGVVGAGEPGAVALREATNVAARVQALAEPGTILVGDAAARRLSTRFLLEPFGEVTVKGRGAPVAVSRLVRAKARERVGVPPPIVGRDEEVARLQSVLDELAAGRGRVVLLAGEAGIGKTRLLEELRSLADDRITWIEGRCPSYGGPAAWPFMEMLLGWLGTEIGGPEIALRTKVRARLAPLLGDAVDEVLPSLGRLLRLRIDAADSNDVAGGYLRWLGALAAERPVVVALDDVHWADAPTRELAESVLDLTDEAPVAVVLSQEPAPRSEGAALRLRALGDFGHRTTELVLGPLPDEAAERLLARILGDGAEIDAATRKRLVREAEGNPLYVEELARAFLEGALERRGRTWTITVRSSELLPPALENLLAARIDRLPDGARRLAHIAAAIGRTFPVRVLEEVAGAHARAGLAALLRDAVVRELRRYPEFECTFAHGLLHEAALSTLTTVRRRELYARVAAAFERLYATSIDDHLERLAHYHAQSGNLPRALEYAERARAALGYFPRK